MLFRVEGRVSVKDRYHEAMGHSCQQSNKLAEVPEWSEVCSCIGSDTPLKYFSNLMAALLYSFVTICPN